MAVKLLKRQREILTALCGPYATLLMVREPNNYRYGVLQFKGRDTIERKILSYDRLMDWVERGWILRMVAPHERYEITPEGRAVIASFDEPEPPAPLFKRLEVWHMVRKVMAK